MPPSVHKIIHHGKAIINHLPISIGHASEEAIETLNKEIRFAREHRTCKSSRTRANSDLFRFLLASSDPLVNKDEKHKRNHKYALHADVKDMLIANTHVLDQHSNDSSSEDEFTSSDGDSEEEHDESDAESDEVEPSE